DLFYFQKKNPRGFCRGGRSFWSQFLAYYSPSAGDEASWTASCGAGFMAGGAGASSASAFACFGSGFSARACFLAPVLFWCICFCCILATAFFITGLLSATSALKST